MKQNLPNIRRAETEHVRTMSSGSDSVPDSTFLPVCTLGDDDSDTQGTAAPRGRVRWRLGSWHWANPAIAMVGI